LQAWRDTIGDHLDRTISGVEVRLVQRRMLNLCAYKIVFDKDYCSSRLSQIALGVWILCQYHLH
jgi:hypothetical protein